MGGGGRGWSEWGGALGEAGGADQSVSAPIKTLNLSEEGNGAKKQLETVLKTGSEQPHRPLRETCVAFALAVMTFDTLKQRAALLM